MNMVSDCEKKISLGTAEIYALSHRLKADYPKSKHIGKNTSSTVINYVSDKSLFFIIYLFFLNNIIINCPQMHSEGMPAKRLPRENMRIFQRILPRNFIANYSTI